MKQRRRENLFYIGILLLAVVSIISIAYFSRTHSDLEATTTSLAKGSGTFERVEHYFDTFLQFVHTHAFSSFGLLLMQVIIILIFARFVAWLFTKMGQPSVIGEIIAGIILGPSVFGLLHPDLFSTIFPTHSLGNISLLSQFGLILFMFVIGMELDLGEIQKTLKKSLIIAHSSIIAPFILGIILVLFLYREYGGASSTPLTFALFFCISLSVTAFPVLARIIQEQNKMNSHIGMLAMSSAASGDITAWCGVATIIAIAQSGSPGGALFTLLFATAYMLVMFKVVRPAFKLIGEAYNTNEVAGKGVIALTFVTLLLSSYITEILGLHALFGAFVAGIVMPTNIKFRHMMTEKVEDVSLSIFLPLFFVSSGLQTEIGLLNTAHHWLITLAIIAIAIVGKVWGTYVACRVVGEDHRDSMYVGILMNTRGLMELIILSMGLQLEILSPIVYAMLVVMTLVTTFITTPMLNIAEAIWRRRDARKGVIEEKPLFRILFSFGRTTTGKLMIDLVHTFFPKTKKQVEVTGMHVTMDSEVNPLHAERYRSEKFDPLHHYSDTLRIPLGELYEVSDHPVQSILKATKTYDTTLLLVGANLDLSQSPEDQRIMQLRDKYEGIYGKTLTGTADFFNIAKIFQDKTKTFVSKTDASVGVVIDKGLNSAARTILILEDPEQPNYNSYLLLVNDLLRNTIPSTHIDTIVMDGRGTKIERANELDKDILTSDIHDQYDLVILPYATWEKLSRRIPEFITYLPTTLLLEARYKSVPGLNK
ncbi:MAG: cation:proton antiporter [Porphyromonas sp.]|nr:cation:proton antiporter [Porphyromonas sp.]